MLAWARDSPPDHSSTSVCAVFILRGGSLYQHLPNEPLLVENRAYSKQTNLTYPLYVPAANDLRRVNAHHPFQAQFVNMEGRAVAVHQHHRRREIKTATRENPERGDTIKSIFRPGGAGN